MALFESYDRRINQINAVLNNYGIKDIEEAKAICDAQGIDPYKMCKDIQPIAFENAAWAYVVGAAIAIKKGCKKAAEAAEAIGEGLQSFCITGSVAADRKVGLGHGNLAAMLLREETKCFRIPCRTRIFRRGRRCHRYRKISQQSTSTTVESDLERLG